MYQWVHPLPKSGALLAALFTIGLPTINAGCTPITEPRFVKPEAADAAEETALSKGAISVIQWHPLALDFTGPATNEFATPNPFTDYRLLVTFTHAERRQVIRGFFAADGDAAHSGADGGNIWRARFAPDLPGEWHYRAELRFGPDIALSVEGDAGDAVPLAGSEGIFVVAPISAISRDMRSQGVLQKSGRYFRFAGSGEYWLKAGANSPENLLGYEDFDGTYRQKAEAREGEAAIDEKLHSFAPHLRDWREGDPVWQSQRGKGLIGAVNYLASQGMNAIYMLTMNVDGDGKDVWPWTTPDDPTRFDVSKLAQWDIVFTHMQQRGIALHLVTQERENELMLDGGDTGRLRRLYYLELIARFAHHPALFWNLGEENGPVHWDPQGQNDAQRKAMAAFINAHDPYGHPVLLHTHSGPKDKDELLTPLLAHPALDGLSFQVAERVTVNAQTRKWLQLSAQAGNVWPITMDEIGKWQIGARADEDDPDHDSLRRHALWGHLLAGGAGVEWYFGAHQTGNDLTTEDWRSRGSLWKQSRHALDFFDAHLPYWQMEPCETVEPLYCLESPGLIYAYYGIAGQKLSAIKGVPDGRYTLQWFDPRTGQYAPKKTEVQMPMQSTTLYTVPNNQKDWVGVLKRTE